MLKLIEVNENGVVYVATEDNLVMGIVNAFEIIDSDGIKFLTPAMEVLERFTDIDQDFENEANVIKLESGETLTLTADSAEIS